MFSISHLAEYIIVLLITTKISQIYCHSGQERENSDISKIREANMDLNSNNMNSSYNTLDEFGPENFETLINKEGYLNKEQKHELNDYYNDFSHMLKRSAHANHRMRKRKQLRRHKKPSEVNSVRTHPVRRKSKAGQSKINVKKIKNDEYQVMTLYGNNKSPFKDNKSKYNPKYNVDMSYNNAKPTQISDENTSNKISGYIKEEIQTGKDSITNITDDSSKNTEGNSIRNTINSDRENEVKNAELCEVQQTDKVYEANKDVQETQRENGNSKNIDESIKKVYGNKLKQKYIHKLIGIETNSDDMENSKQESKQDISNLSKTDSSDQNLSEISAQSRKNVKHMKSHQTDIYLNNSPNENNINEGSRTQNNKGSENDEFDENKNTVLGSKVKQSKPGEYINDKGNIFESKQNPNDIPRDSSVDVSQTSNESYLSTDNEKISSSATKHTKHKIGHKQIQNYNHRETDVQNQNSMENSNRPTHDLTKVKQKKRPQKNAPIKRRHSPKSESDWEYYGNTNKDTHLDYSNLDTQENTDILEHATHVHKDEVNKRNQRDLNKRLRKHNNYKNNDLQEGNLFGYHNNNDDEEDLNVREIQKIQNSYNEKGDDSSEYHHRKFDVNSNFNDKYSYKEPLEEEIGVVDDEESTNNKIHNRKKTLLRQSQEHRQKGDIKEKCVGYKAEKVTKKTTFSTKSTTEKCTTKGTSCATKRTTVKPKTTPQTCNKSPTTKNITFESIKIGSNTSEAVIDIFDKYLCGQLADEFVDTVMDKVKRSRKIYKELGFRNDSEESCDRCIETKPNKIPDKEIVKTSLGKCLKNKEHKSGCYMCYSVPKQMEKVLNLLVMFEKEHENSVYSKIRDDSSFIFTGDYPEQFNQIDNSVGNKYKYKGDSDSFSKETFDKQDLREDSNEDKHDDQVVKHAVEDEVITSESESKLVEYSTELVEKQNKNTDKIIDTKLNVQKGIKNRDNGKHSLNLVEQEENNNLSDEDLNVAPINRYSSLKEPEIEKLDESFDRATIKERRKAFKSDKLVDPKNTGITPKDSETENTSNMKTHNFGEHNFGFTRNKLSKDRYDYENQPYLTKDNNEINALKNVRKYHKTPYQNKGRLHDENKILSPVNYLSSDKLSHKLNHFSYPSEDYNDEGGHLHFQNNGHSVANGFMSSGWDSDEYQLMPKQPDRDVFDNMINSVPRKRYYNKDYEEGLNMVKRESEPSYEDEPLFIEIPNFEYDLY